MADMSVLSLNIYTQLCYIHSKRVNVDTLPLTYLHQNSVSAVRFVLNVGTHIHSGNIIILDVKMSDNSDLR